MRIERREWALRERCQVLGREENAVRFSPYIHDVNI